MTPAESDNPYARQSAYGRMPQVPFRIGPLPKASPPTPAPAPPTRSGGVLSGSAIPLTPRREATPSEPAPPEPQIVEARAPEPLVVPVAPVRRRAPEKGRWLVAGVAAAIMAAAGAAFLLLGRGAPEPVDPPVVADTSPAPVPEATPPPPLPDTLAQTVPAPAAKAPVRASAPVQKAAPQPAPVVETPATEPAPVIAPPPVLNLPQAAPALPQPLDPDAPLSTGTD